MNFAFAFEEDSCNLEIPVLAFDNDRWGIFEEGFDKVVMRRSRGTSGGLYLFVIRRFRLITLNSLVFC